MFKKRTLFLPLEVSLLSSLCGAVPIEMAEHLKNQLSTIKKIQRINDDREVDLYYQPPINSPDAATNRIMPYVGESKFATIKFMIPEKTSEILADFWLVNGYLFSINFNISPKEYAKRDVINVREILLHRGHEHLYGQYVEITKSIIDFLEESENLNINDWVMFEENDIATIRLASEEYYVFAKHNSDSRFLLVKYGDRKIYHVEHEDLKPKLLKDNL
ncbi:MAG TPA: hypothetical protein DD726_06040 [Phycisphaerales bacterium]|nr:hypothetical protein [Phycisphaerales bacterium]